MANTGASPILLTPSFRKTPDKTDMLQNNPPEMTAKDVIEIVQLFSQHHIDICIDGGWGVDALLGAQTRPHADLDIAMPHKDVTLARRLLDESGFVDVLRGDTRECNFVMG